MLANFDNSGTIRLGYKIVTVNNKDPKTSEIGRYNFVKYTTHFWPAAANLQVFCATL